MNCLTLKAYILAGGLGTRLFPLTLTTPKPLLMLGQKTIIEHILDRLANANFEEIIMVLSSRGWMYRATIGDNYMGVKIKYVEDTSPRGTAGQLKRAAGGEREPFFVSYSDSIVDANFNEAIDIHFKNHALATVFVFDFKSKISYGQIIVRKGEVKGWKEKPSISVTAAAGAFIFDPKFLNYVPSGQRYGMNTAINEALKAGEKVLAYTVKSFVDVGDRKKYLQAVKDEIKRIGEIP